MVRKKKADYKKKKKICKTNQNSDNNREQTEYVTEKQFIAYRLYFQILSKSK